LLSVASKLRMATLTLTSQAVGCTADAGTRTGAGAPLPPTPLRFNRPEAPQPVANSNSEAVAADRSSGFNEQRCNPRSEMGKHGTGGDERDSSKDKDKQGTFVGPTKGGDKGKGSKGK